MDMDISANVSGLYSVGKFVSDQNKTGILSPMSTTSDAPSTKNSDVTDHSDTSNAGCFKGKVYYLDTDNISSGKRKNIEMRLVALGAKVERFLSREVTCVITGGKCSGNDKPSVDSSSQRVTRSPSAAVTQSPSSTRVTQSPSTRVTQSPSTRATQSPSTRATQSPSTRVTQSPSAVLSRGKALLLKSNAKTIDSSLCKSRSGNAVSFAQQWGIDVKSTKELHDELKLYNKIAGEVVVKSKKKPKLSTKNLSGAYIKFEDSDCLHRPCWKILKTFPAVNINPDADPDCCSPFDNDTTIKSKLKPKNMDSSKCRNPQGKENIPVTCGRDSSKIVHGNSKTNTTKPKTHKKSAVKLSGYCECCETYYSDLGQHVKSQVHITFSYEKENFRSLDDLVALMPSLDYFVHDYEPINVIQKLHFEELNDRSSTPEPCVLPGVAPSNVDVKSDMQMKKEHVDHELIHQDTRTGSESRAVIAPRTPQDTRTGSESRAVIAPRTPQDTRTGSESRAVIAPRTPQDTQTGSESRAVIAPRIPQDTRAGSESRAVIAPGTPRDTPVPSAEEIPKLNMCSEAHPREQNIFVMAHPAESSVRETDASNQNEPHVDVEPVSVPQLNDTPNPVSYVTSVKTIETDVSNIPGMTSVIATLSANSNNNEDTHMNENKYQSSKTEHSASSTRHPKSPSHDIATSVHNVSGYEPLISTMCGYNLNPRINTTGVSTKLPTADVHVPILPEHVNSFLDDMNIASPPDIPCPMDITTSELCPNRVDLICGSNLHANPQISTTGVSTKLHTENVLILPEHVNSFLDDMNIASPPDIPCPYGYYHIGTVSQ